MKSSSPLLRNLAAILFCLLLQCCTRDIPTPVSPKNNPIREALLKNMGPNDFIKGNVLTKREKVEVVAPKPTSTQPKGSKTHTSQLLAVCYNYYAVGWDVNSGTEVFREFLYTDCTSVGSNGEGVGGTSTGTGDSGGSGSAGDGASTSAISPTTVLVVPPDKPVQNVREYLKCFTASQGAKFTVYARQPRPGTTDSWTWPLGNKRPDVGHTFISITQNGITRVLGFYPTSDKAIVDDGPSIMGDNSQNPYTVKITTTLSPARLAALLAYIDSHSSDTYSLENYNCTDFGVGAAAATGLTLPDPHGSWGTGSGSTPAVLGQDMRTMPLPAGAIRNTHSGTSPANAGGC